MLVSKGRKDERIAGAGDKQAVNQLALNTALLEECGGNGRSICYCDQYLSAFLAFVYFIHYRRPFEPAMLMGDLQPT